MSFVPQFITQQPQLQTCLFDMKGKNMILRVPLRKEKKWSKEEDVSLQREKKSPFFP